MRFSTLLAQLRKTRGGTLLVHHIRAPGYNKFGIE